MDLPAQQVTSHALLTLPDTLTELDLLLPPDPTILSQTLASGRDTTLLSNAFDLSIEYPRGMRDEDDPLSQFVEDGNLDFGIGDRSFSVERGRDAASIGLEDEFSIKGLGDDLDFGLDKPASALGEEDDGLGGGFGDGGLDFGFGDELQPMEPLETMGNNGTLPSPSAICLLLPLQDFCEGQKLMLDFAEALLNPNDDAEGTLAPAPIVAKLVRKRKLLTADSEIEISKKEYSQHLKDTSNIIKKVHRPLPTKSPPPLSLSACFVPLNPGADGSNDFCLVMRLL